MLSQSPRTTAILKTQNEFWIQKLQARKANTTKPQTSIPHSADLIPGISLHGTILRRPQGRGVPETPLLREMKHPILQGSLPDTTCLYLMCLACAAFPPSLFSAAVTVGIQCHHVLFNLVLGKVCRQTARRATWNYWKKNQGSLRDSPPSCLPQTRPAKVRDPLDTSARSTSRLRAFQVNPLTINPLQKRKDHLGRNVHPFRCATQADA